ncbi:MAG: exodeoxyribonuclease V subunit gamma, partial [Anaerolineales bacterium]|nr:exodeoxyribonuclease V subunit gamma [Anaerolineales bacterium]
VQLRVILALEKQIPDIYITLTGTKSGFERPLVHKRFLRTLSLLRASTDPEIITLEELGNKEIQTNLISNIERSLFQVKENKLINNDQILQMIAVPDREAEVRNALRWVKSLIVKEELSPEQITIMMRKLEPYRPLLVRIAGEYGIPVRIQGGIPLNENPVISAIFNVVDLITPGKEYLNWRAVVEAWRSPYFNWDCLIDNGEEPRGQETHLKDANRLVQLVHWGSVIHGYQQWEEVFSQLIGKKISDGTVIGDEAERLWKKFQRFIEVMMPPADAVGLNNFIAWVENLIGDEEEHENSSGLGVIEKIKEGPSDLIRRDLQAIRSLKKIFKELIWTENTLQPTPGSFRKFSEDVQAIVKRTSYQPEEDVYSGVYCADITEVRGVPFRAAAILGLAEGEFPQTIKEDPFLRDGDRSILQEEDNLPLRQSTDSAEAEYFYEAITRASDRVLLTRPRIADNGAPWQPSPYWEEILRCVDITPQVLTSRSKPSLETASSDLDLLETLSAGPTGAQAWKWAEENLSESVGRINQAQRLLASRSKREDSPGDIYDGNLNILGDYFSNRFDSDQVWSASRLENYQACPYYFFVASVLGLERIDPPQEGLDARQLGNIYHHILENLY